MKLNDLEELRDNVWIIGVSGGADSMALLDMCHKENIDVIVAHMNYKKRDSADRDMEGVKRYCDRNKIQCHINIMTKKSKDNFQAFARVERYTFYKELIDTYHAAGVLVGHHLDDHLETYMMQKERNSIPDYYGIQRDSFIMGCLIKRVLLSYTKEELKLYCDEHMVTYYDDESNYARTYTRNRIRQDKIDCMDRKQKEELVKIIAQENDMLDTMRKKVRDFYKDWNKDIKTLLMQEESFQVHILDYMVHDITGEHVSKKELHTILLQCKGANNWTRSVTSVYDIYNSYGYLSIHKQEEDYAYVLDNVTYIQTPYFEIKKEGKSTESVTLYEDDFPITIRNVKESDYIQLRLGKKKIHRWFIDRKIPLYERRIWPVVVNAKGKIILVPKIGCDIEHFSNNPVMFVIK